MPETHPSVPYLRDLGAAPATFTTTLSNLLGPSIYYGLNRNASASAGRNEQALYNS